MGDVVFINYRGEDSEICGALLYTDLARRFGRDRVFLDSESIPAGADFATELLQQVRSACVLLAVIGPRWLAADPSGRRGIDDPADWIRRELVEAFAAGVRVIPVLTDHAELPSEADLPADIAGLSRCQYRYLRRREPTTDLDRIVADLTGLDPTLQPPHPDDVAGHPPGVVQHITASGSNSTAQGVVRGDIHHHPARGRRVPPPPDRDTGTCGDTR